MENNITLEQLLDKFSDLTKYKADMKSRFPDILFIYQNGNEKFTIFHSSVTLDGQTLGSFVYAYDCLVSDPETGKLKPARNLGYRKKDIRLEQLYSELKQLNKIE